MVLSWIVDAVITGMSWTPTGVFLYLIFKLIRPTLRQWHLHYITKKYPQAIVLKPSSKTKNGGFSNTSLTTTSNNRSRNRNRNGDTSLHVWPTALTKVPDSDAATVSKASTTSLSSAIISFVLSCIITCVAFVLKVVVFVVVRGWEFARHNILPLVGISPPKYYPPVLREPSRGLGLVKRDNQDEQRVVFREHSNGIVKTESYYYDPIMEPTNLVQTVASRTPEKSMRSISTPRARANDSGGANSVSVSGRDEGDGFSTPQPKSRSNSQSSSAVASYSTPTSASRSVFDRSNENGSNGRRLIDRIQTPPPKMRQRRNMTALSKPDGDGARANGAIASKRASSTRIVGLNRRTNATGHNNNKENQHKSRSQNNNRKPQNQPLRFKARGAKTLNRFGRPSNSFPKTSAPPNLPLSEQMRKRRQKGDPALEVYTPSAKRRRVGRVALKAQRHCPRIITRPQLSKREREEREERLIEEMNRKRVRKDPKAQNQAPTGQQVAIPSATTTFGAIVPTSAAADSQKPAAAGPVPSQGDAAPTFTFGSTSTSASTSAPAPAVSGDAKAGTAPAFSLDATSASALTPVPAAPAATAAPKSDATPAFSFGSTAAPASAAASTSTAPPAAAAPAASQPAGQAPAFSFGAVSTPTKPAPSTVGAPATPAPAPVSTPGFQPPAAAASGKPAFSFGAPAQVPAPASVPTPAFGAVPAPAPSATPAFSFGAASAPAPVPAAGAGATPAFSFGAAASSAPIAAAPSVQPFGGAAPIAAPGGASGFSLGAPAKQPGIAAGGGASSRRRTARQRRRR